MFSFHIKIKNYLNRGNRFLVFSLAFLLVFSLASYALAAARTSPFTPGETLDPGAESVEPCGPTDTNCFVSVLSSLNALTGGTQTFAVGTSGTDFAISSSGTTHTFNIPDVSATARGLVTTGTQTIAGVKTFSSNPVFSANTIGSVYFAGTDGALTQDNTNLFFDNSSNELGIGTATPSAFLHVIGTTEQLRVGYDASNYVSTTVGSTGSTTFDLTGTSPTFTFSDDVGVGTAPSAGLHVLKTTEQLRVGYDASNYYSTTVGSTGGVTFNAVGSGQKFTFNDDARFDNSSNSDYIQLVTSGGEPYIQMFNSGLIDGRIYMRDSGVFSFHQGGSSNYMSIAGLNGTFYGGTINVGDLGATVNTHAVINLLASSSAGAQAYARFANNGTEKWAVGVVQADNALQFAYGQATLSGGTLRAALTSDGDFGIGTTTSPSARLHLIKTTEQFRAGYDTSNYINLTVSSAGVGAFATSGTATTPFFTFNKDLTVQSVTVGRGPGGILTNAVLGYQALNSNSTMNNSTVVGYQAGYSGVSAFYNTYIGTQAGYTGTNGDSNTALGRRALYLNQSGYANTALGTESLYNVTSNSNVGVGYQAGYSIAGGTHNVYVGQGAGGSVTTHANSNSIGIGKDALYNGAGNSVAIGYGALDAVANTSSGNVALGGSAGGGLATGNLNIMLGYGAGVSVTDASNNIYIGNFDGTGFTTSSGNIFISEPGGSAAVRLHIDSSGNMVVGGTTPVYRLDVRTTAANYAASIFNDGNDASRSGLRIQSGLDDHTAAGPSTLIGFFDGDGGAVGSITFASSATAYNTTSDQRLKQNIVDTALSIDLLNQIQIRDYSFIADSTNTTRHGVLAQELHSVYPDAVTVPTNPDEYWMVDYSKLTPLLVKAVQDIDVKVEGLDPVTNTSFASKFVAYFANTANGIGDFFANRIRTQEICLGQNGNETCISKTQLDTLLQGSGSTNSFSGGVQVPSSNSSGSESGDDNSSNNEEEPNGGDSGTEEESSSTETSGNSGDSSDEESLDGSSAGSNASGDEADTGNIDAGAVNSGTDGQTTDEGGGTEGETTTTEPEGAVESTPPSDSQ